MFAVGVQPGHSCLRSMVADRPDCAPRAPRRWDSAWQARPPSPSTGIWHGDRSRSRPAPHPRDRAPASGGSPQQVIGRYGWQQIFGIHQLPVTVHDLFHRNAADRDDLFGFDAGVRTQDAIRATAIRANQARGRRECERMTVIWIRTAKGLTLLAGCRVCAIGGHAPCDRASQTRIRPAVSAARPARRR